jgi:PIN domain nuclease of toxin-antitoxin system
MRVRRVLLKDDSQLWLSSISIWETLLLADRGRLSLGREPARWIDEALTLMPINEAPVTIDVGFRANHRSHRSDVLEKSKV